jgi:hypothetical protein
MNSSFLQFMQQMMGQEQAAPPAQGNELLMALLALMQQGVDGSRSDRAATSPLQPFQPGAGGPMFGGPDVGDLYDYHNADGDPGITGLFGSNPVPLRQPPPGIDQRRRGMP